MTPTNDEIMRETARIVSEEDAPRLRGIVSVQDELHLMSAYDAPEIRSGGWRLYVAVALGLLALAGMVLFAVRVL